MLLTAHVTPRGFSVPMKPSFEAIEKEGHPRTDELFDYLRTKPTDGVAYQLDVIEEAKKLFEVDGKLSLSTWIEFMISNPNPKMGYLHYSFLLETINFIATGFRRVSPMTMISLLDSETDVTKQTLSHQSTFKEIIQKLKERCEEVKKSRMDTEFIYWWTAQRDGVTDLVYTLQLIYSK